MSEVKDQPTEPLFRDRMQFAEALWDVIDNTDVSLEYMIAELDEAIRCLEKRRG